MRKNYPRLRNGKLEGTGMPPYVVLDDEKEVLFYIPNGFPLTLGIPTWMKQYFPDDYKGLVIRSEEAFNKYKKRNEL